MRLQFILGEMWNGLRRNASMAVSVALVTMISMFLLGLGLLAQQQVATMKGYWYDKVEVTVHLCVPESPFPACGRRATTPEQKQAIETQLKALPAVAAVTYESREEAYAHFKEQYKSSPLGRATSRSFADSYRVKLRSAEKFDTVSSAVEGMPGVGQVQDQRKVLDKLFQFMNAASWAAIGLAGLMALCSVLLMATTIRQTAFSRRRETGIMRLVGATNFTIRMPFVLETVVSSLVGAVLAMALLWATVRYAVSGYLSHALLDTAFIGTDEVLRVAPWIILAVLVLAVVTSWTTLRRYLRV